MNQSKKHDKRFWSRWVAAGAVAGVKKVSDTVFLVSRVGPATVAQMVARVEKLGLRPATVDEVMRIKNPYRPPFNVDSRFLTVGE